MTNDPNGATAEGMSDLIGTHDPETALANAICLVDLAVGLAMESMRVAVNENGKDEYRTPYAHGNQLIALLVTIRDAGEQTLAIRDAASAARRVGR